MNWKPLDNLGIRSFIKRLTERQVQASANMEITTDVFKKNGIRNKLWWRCRCETYWETLGHRCCPTWTETLKFPRPNIVPLREKLVLATPAVKAQHLASYSTLIAPVRATLGRYDRESNGSGTWKVPTWFKTILHSFHHVSWCRLRFTLFPHWRRSRHIFYCRNWLMCLFTSASVQISERHKCSESEVSK